jgi:hypothetical protein
MTRGTSSSTEEMLREMDRNGKTLKDVKKHQKNVEGHQDFFFFFFFQKMKDTMKTPRDDGGTRKMPNNTKEMWGDAK